MIILALDKIGIIGGTFDPIHYGHLIAAEWAKDEYNLNKIIFMPAAEPPHKNIDEVLDKNYRYNMVKVAIGDNPDFEISDYEMKKSGKSYTFATLNYFKTIYPHSQLYFIIGLDSLLNIDTWKNVEELFNLATFLVATRAGYNLEKNHPIYSKLPKYAWDKISFYKIPEIGISSSNIRQRVREEKSIKYLIPDVVEKYILENNIYGA